MRPDNEIIAIANQLKASTEYLIHSLEEYEKLLNQLNINKAKKLHTALNQFCQSTELITFLKTINLEIANIAETKSDVTNLYHNYFLTQVSRYNALFLRIAKKNKEDATIHTADMLSREFNLKPFNHPILGEANFLTVTYEVKHKGIVFDEPLVAEYKRKKRYYYNKKNQILEIDGKKINFVDYYKAANVKIGKATQISNLRGFFTVSVLSQLRVMFMRARDKIKHLQEKLYFKSAWNKIKTGNILSDNEKAVLTTGTYYRGTGAATVFSNQANQQKQLRHFHIGHASELVTVGNITIANDLVNYDCGSKSNIFYPRNTEPGIPTDSYPLIPVVFYSHNHHDHMEEHTLKEALPAKNALIIVPVGDGALLKSWGYRNVVEISSWNESVEVTTRDANGNSHTIEIHALPARHSSNRLLDPAMPDISTSLYMGCFIHDKATKHVTLITGDTGVLSEEHYQQLEKYLLDNDLTVASACLAAGPDRPRKYMECTHQSTADALTLHARLNAINAKVIVKRMDTPSLMCDFNSVCCKAQGYHQGCYRLGVLNYNDVEGTLTRSLAALKQYGDLTIEGSLKLLEDENKSLTKSGGVLEPSNYYFAIMDQFERDGLLNTLRQYQTLIDQGVLKSLSAEQLFECICQNTFLPVPGQTLDFSKNPQSFSYDYQRLIVNRDPSGHTTRAYEDFINALTKKNFNFDNYIKDDKIISPKLLVETLLKLYVERTARTITTKKKKNIVANFLKEFKNVADEPVEIKKFLIKLRGKITNWQTCDEKQRDEGHLETLLLIINGLLDDEKFRKQFLADYSLKFTPLKATI